MRVLLIGAGAVGQCYGWQLAQAGCDVSFLVKPKYAGMRSLWVYPGDRKAVEWTGFGVVTEPIEADQVWYCVSSPQLRSCPEQLPGDPLVVYLQPGLHDGRWMRERFSEAQLVRGLIPFIAWKTPLPGETRSPEGVAWWFPPMMRLSFSGPRANEVTRVLPRAHMVADAGHSVLRTSASMLPTIACLELAGWSLRALDRKLAAQAAREATTITCAVHALPPSRTPPPFALGLLAGLAPWLVPFDLETYLRYHFMKVGDQTRVGLENWIREGGERGLPVQTLEEVLARVLVIHTGSNS